MENEHTNSCSLSAEKVGIADQENFNEGGSTEVGP
jgi:hypothetical protein